MDKIDERLTSHYQLLSRTIDFTKAADAKAAPIVALHIALVGALTFRSVQLFSVLGQCPWDFERISLTAVSFLYVCVSICAIFVAGRVFFPKTPRNGSSLIYFEDIASMDFDEYQDRSENLNPHTIENELLQQTFQVSMIVSGKMRLVKLALGLSAVAVLFWISLMLYSSIAATSISKGS